MLIGAHPDDVEIGMGGTACALSKAGHNVVLVDLTDGEPTPYGSREIRAQESAAAAKALGISKRITLDLTNRELFDTVEARKKLASLMREHKPEVLFIPYWQDGHPDHIQAEALSIAARFYSKFVRSDLPYDPYYPRKVLHYFCTHLRVRFEPSFLFDISNYIDDKFNALNEYKSQFAKNPNNAKFLDILKTENNYWGNQVGVEFAEPFVSKERVSINSAEALLAL